MSENAKKLLFFVPRRFFSTALLIFTSCESGLSSGKEKCTFDCLPWWSFFGATTFYQLIHFLVTFFQGHMYNGHMSDWHSVKWHVSKGHVSYASDTWPSAALNNYELHIYAETHLTLKCFHGPYVGGLMVSRVGSWHSVSGVLFMVPTPTFFSTSTVKFGRFSNKYKRRKGGHGICFANWTGSK